MTGRRDRLVYGTHFAGEDVFHICEDPKDFFQLCGDGYLFRLQSRGVFRTQMSVVVHFNPLAAI